MSFVRSRFLSGGGENNHLQTNSANFLIEDHTSGDLVYVGSTLDQDLSIWRSQDGGLTWTLEHSIDQEGGRHCAVWFDRWSQISDNTVHIAYSETSADDILYRSYQIDTNTLSSAVVVYAGASTETDQGNMSIGLAEDGDIFITGFIDDGIEGGDWVSSNGGSSWQAITFATLAESSGVDDFGFIVPTLGFTTRTGDIAYIYYDHSATEVTVKYFNSSTGQIDAETTILSVGQLPQQADVIWGIKVMDIALDLTNDLVYLVFWNDERDVATADLVCYELDFSGGSSSITAKTNVVTNGAIGGGNASITIDDTNGDLYVFYQASENEVGGTYGGGSYYYKKSTDGGTTWSQEYVLPLSQNSAEIMTPAVMFTTWKDWKITPCIGYTGAGENNNMVVSEIYRPNNTFAIAF